MEDEVVDYTRDSRTEEEGQIRLRTGIDLNQLQGPNGVIFEPEIDESFFENNARDRTYFSNMEDDEHLEELMGKFSLDQNLNTDDESDDDNLSEFENKLRRMKPIEIEMPVGEGDGGEAEQITVDGVQKRILKKGLESYGNVTHKSTVTIHYSLYFSSQDEPYDSSVLRGRPERYRLDDGRLLIGIELAIKSMLKNEKSEFIIQPEYGFGKMGCPPRVPGDAQIFAVIELLSVVQEAEAEALMSMTPEERGKKKTFGDILKAAQVENEDGNSFVREKEFLMAAKRYDRGIRLLEEVELKDDHEEMEQKKWLVKLYLNHGHCGLQLRRPKRVCTDMRKALEIINPRDAKAKAKALYRMGKAKVLLGHSEEAMSYYKRAQKFLPHDTDIGQEVVRLEGEIIKVRQSEKDLCMRMVGQRVPAQGDNAAASPNNQDLNFDVDDDFYSEMYEQLEAYKNSDDKEPLVLPSSINGQAEVNFTRRIVNELGLEMKERNRNNITQWMIFK